MMEGPLAMMEPGVEAALLETLWGNARDNFGKALALYQGRPIVFFPKYQCHFF